MTKNIVNYQYKSRLNWYKSVEELPTHCEQMIRNNWLEITLLGREEWRLGLQSRLEWMNECLLDMTLAANNAATRSMLLLTLLKSCMGWNRGVQSSNPGLTIAGAVLTFRKLERETLKAGGRCRYLSSTNTFASKLIHAMWVWWTNFPKLHQDWKSIAFSSWSLDREVLRYIQCHACATSFKFQLFWYALQCYEFSTFTYDHILNMQDLYTTKQNHQEIFAMNFLHSEGCGRTNVTFANMHTSVTTLKAFIPCDYHWPSLRPVDMALLTLKGKTLCPSRLPKSLFSVPLYWYCREPSSVRDSNLSL